MGDADHLIANMRGRIEQCRRLARSTYDKEVAELLLKMANEGEADVQRLEAERDATQP